MALHMDPTPHDVTLLIHQAGQGDQAASASLMTLVYKQLRNLAASYYRQQQPGHTLQPTALVHEAFLRLLDQPPDAFADRAHFFAVAATAMRQILCDYARRKKTAKRGGEMERVALDQAELISKESDIDLEALDAALTELREMDERKHRVVELRFFGGLTVDEIVGVMDVSRSTVESDWRAARAWLSMRLSSGNPQ
jgi:RNA polymerase sigma-70 factor, ECF subfamily